MRADEETERAVLDVLDRFAEAVGARDAEAVLALFAADEDVCSIGSEAGELRRGHGEIATFLRRVLSAPQRYRWEWSRRDVSAQGDVAWLVAEGTSRIERASGVEEAPYRLTAVLARRDAAWQILLFHGSEPADTRAEG